MRLQYLSRCVMHDWVSYRSGRVMQGLSVGVFQSVSQWVCVFPCGGILIFISR